MGLGLVCVRCKGLGWWFLGGVMGGRSGLWWQLRLLEVYQSKIYKVCVGGGVRGWVAGWGWGSGTVSWAGCHAAHTVC